MDRKVHLEVGTRVINARTGKLGVVAAPHYLARLDPHEICVHYDGTDPESSDGDDRADIEYAGNGAFEREYARREHPGRENFRLGDRVVIARTREQGTVVHDVGRVCDDGEVPVECDGDQGYVGIGHRGLYKITEV